jgi:hypothetical protein
MTVEEYREWLATPHMGAVNELEKLLGRLGTLRRKRYPELETRIEALVEEYSSIPKLEVVFYSDGK